MSSTLFSSVYIGTIRAIFFVSKWTGTIKPRRWPSYPVPHLHFMQLVCCRSITPLSRYFISTRSRFLLISLSFRSMWVLLYLFAPIYILSCRYKRLHGNQMATSSAAYKLLYLVTLLLAFMKSKMEKLNKSVTMTTPPSPPYSSSLHLQPHWNVAPLVISSGHQLVSFLSLHLSNRQYLQTLSIFKLIF